MLSSDTEGHIAMRHTATAGRAVTVLTPSGELAPRDLPLQASPSRPNIMTCTISMQSCRMLDIRKIRDDPDIVKWAVEVTTST